MQFRAKTFLVLLGTSLALVTCGRLPSGQLAVVCYEQDGRLAEAFAGGAVIHDLPGSSSEAVFGTLLAPIFYDFGPGEEHCQKGNLVLVGEARPGDQRRFLVSRYQELNGEPEPTFGVDGVVTTAFPGATAASALALQMLRVGSQTGELFVAGKAQLGEGNRFALARYTWEGRLRDEFGGDGLVLTPFPEADDAVARAIAAASLDGEEEVRVVAAGDALISGGRQFALARYGRRGDLDPGFSDDGRQLTDFPESTSEYITGVAIVIPHEEDPKIVAAGAGLVGERYRLALARYRWDGNLDPAFGDGGRLLIEVPGTLSSYAEALKIDHEGRILIAGWAKRSDSDEAFLVGRFTSNGTPDATFGSGGFVLIDFPEASGERSHGLDLDREGRIVMAGQAFVGAGWQFALARVLADGRPDPTFDGDGRVLTNLATRHELARAVTVQRGGAGSLLCAAGEAGS